MRNSDRIEFCTLNGDTIGASREFTLHYIGIWYSEKIWIPNHVKQRKCRLADPFAVFTQYITNTPDDFERIK